MPTALRGRSSFSSSTGDLNSTHINPYPANMKNMMSF